MSTFLPYDMRPQYDRVAEFRVRDMFSTGSAVISPAKRYKHVRICVGIRSVEFRKFEVTFANQPKSRATQKMPIKRLMKPGECTSDIDLTDKNGRPQRLKNIRMVFSAHVKSGPQPIVHVYTR